jgi:hypothetical protein|mmetsp:Transcript_24241/g.52399  ORF Transcript_24241/g.52399 Transcript_24241/m.52399 type:complete len:111 (-) Transcript_24241:2530-2862(-)
MAAERLTWPRWTGEWNGLLRCSGPSASTRATIDNAGLPGGCGENNEGGGDQREEIARQSIREFGDVVHAGHGAIVSDRGDAVYDLLRPGFQLREGVDEGGAAFVEDRRFG